MVGFIVFLSIFATMGMAWFGVTIAYILHIGGFERLLSLPVSEFILLSAGLFCPLVVLALGVGLVYTALEMRKTQMLLNMYLRKGASVSKPVEEIKEEPAPVPEPEPVPEAEKEEETTEPVIQDRPVLNISTQEKLETYKDVALPENLDLHFVDKT